MRKIKLLIAMFIMPLLFIITIFSSINLSADEGRVIRVGWFESVFNQTDEFGRRSGYSYDYQQKLSVYSNWKYEYVSGSWPELLDMLIEGKIDLLSDVSYTEDRATKMLYSSMPMGTEDYYLFKSPNNKTIINDDFQTFNGKKVGINKGSIMIDQFKNWEKINKVDAEIVELTVSVDEALGMLNRGTLDMYISMDGSVEMDKAMPLCRIGSSDFYFAVRKDGEDILNELNYALNRIVNENSFYNQELHNKYFLTSGINLYLSEEEKNWISNHGKIKVGYQDNYLAFCAADKNGELTGALKDYLMYASDSLNNAHLEFEAIAYPTATEALEALNKGEIDCMFPANLSVYDGETQGIFMTNPFMRTEIAAIILESDQKTFIKKEHVVVAVNANNKNYDMFLIDNFPDWRAVYFKDTNECLKGISEGKADCLLISNYRFNNLAAECSKYNLVSLSTGVEMDYCFAVKRTDSTLYSILNKVIGVVPESSVNTSLSYYYTEDAKVGFGDFLSQYLGIIMVVLGIIGVVILFLILRNVLIEKKFRSRQSLIKATEIDDKTLLYNKNYFLEYASRLNAENPNKPMDAIEINIERFHFVNDLNGREFGDQVLRELSDEIRTFLKENEGIAGHSEGDRFSIYCSHLEEYRTLFDRIQGRIDMLSSNASIRIRMGVMPWEKNINPIQQIEQAAVACGLAMREFKDNLVVFDETMRVKEALNQRLLNDLRSSIDNNEFIVYYQPKYNVTGEKPKLVGMEALIRWKHHELGFIFPNDFIPLFERNGQIALLDKYVRIESVKQIAKWKEKYGIVVPVSVNISRVEILDDTFEDSLDVLLDEYGLDKKAINLEVTESAYIDNADRFIKVINSLRRTGYKIEMDDFGTGYSSLNMLSLMPIDILKMDRAFISDIETNEKNVHFVELIIGIARNLRVPVIAEGVETESQLNILKALGCDMIQGYYFSKPLPAEEFEKTILDKIE